MSAMSWKTHLAADRTSFTKATANQFRLFLAGASLADVGPSRLDAETLDVARRPVRHLAPTPHQNRRPRRRNENDDPRALADLVARRRISCASLCNAYHASSRI